MPSIFDLASELQKLMVLATTESEDGEISPELCEWIDKAEGDFDQKVEAWASVIGELEAIKDARSKELERIRSLRDSTENAIGRMRSILKGVMINTGRSRVDTTRYKVWIQKAGGKLSVHIPDESIVPERFIETQLVQRINRDLVRDALEGGEDLGFASLAPRSDVLRIK